MGEVYRARDSKLKRDVAIKILPDAFARDSERMARFQREAEALAALNHPNIGGIYDFASDGNSRFLVLELIEGETLAERISRGPIPIDEALPIARQIAEALEAAHERGIVHRDLKPANIKVTPEGKVKVLDFGLAKAFDTADTTLTNSPTLSIVETLQGTILGTAAYMSPEQSRGRTIDKRADIWAFGCVFYEMLTAKQAFKGSNVSDTIASILRDTPNYDLTAALPRSVVSLLRRCLQKDASKRLRDIGEARIALEEFSENDASSSDAVIPVQAPRNRLAWILLGLSGLVILVLAVPASRYWRESPGETPEMRLEITTPATASPLHFAISPDGSQMAFVASGDGAPRLWVRSIDNTKAQVLPGTDGAEFPFWAPNSRTIAFFADTKLKRIDISGGAMPEVIANAAGGRGGDWSRDGIILFSPSAGSPLMQISGSGEIKAATKLVSTESSHRFPRFLPDGRHFLYFVQGAAGNQGIYLGSLDGMDSKFVVTNDTAGAWAPPGRLLFVRQGSLVSRALDVDTGKLSGDPVTIAHSVAYDTTFYQAGFSVSQAGTVAYRSGGPGLQKLLWFDRAGNNIGAVGGDKADAYNYPQLSPDGASLGVGRAVQGNVDVWLIGILKGGIRKLTFNDAIDTAPVFSPDSKRILFRSNRKSANNLYLKSLDGDGNEEKLLEPGPSRTPLDWCKEGNTVIYYEVSSKTGYDLWTLPMSGERKPSVFANSTFNEAGGKFSPDCHWVAYQSDDSGRFEINIAPFPPTGGTPFQISRNGGTMPQWRDNSKELYFVSPDSKLMVVTLTFPGKTVESSAPTSLFPLKILGGGGNIIRPQYDVSHDGHFLVNSPMEDANSTPITLLLNWKEPTR
jgi:serine/threonine protein kinase/Tol biopolymer transport system component